MKVQSGQYNEHIQGISKYLCNTSCVQNVLQPYSLIYISPLEGNKVITSVLYARQAKYRQIKWQEGREMKTLILIQLGPISYTMLLH